MKNTLIGLFILSNLLLAQSFEVKDLAQKGSEQHFPLIISKTHPKIAEKMNIILQLDILKHLPGKYKDPFKLMGYSSCEDFSYILGKKHLNISVGIEGCGAYCEYYTRNFNFDLRTANGILLRDIVSKKGIKKLEKDIRDRSIKQIETAISKLAKGKEQEDAEALNMYKDCLAVRKREKFYFKLDRGVEFKLTKYKIIFTHGRCSNHAMRALDDIGDFVNSFKLKTIKPYLTKYGKTFLSGKKLKYTSPYAEQKLYKGYINKKYPITLYLNSISKEGFVEAIYWYNKYKTPIELSGTYKNGHFSLKEGENAIIEADLKEKKRILGTYKKLKSSKKMSFDVSSY